MIFRKSILLLIGLGMIAALVACTSGTPPITVTLSAVSSPLVVNSQTPITATTNDTAGVTWKCVPASTCGTFAPSSTLSGAATTYTAPAIITSNVVVTATSVTNPAISASTSAITITGATLADGNYVFSLFGSDVASGQYSLSGVFTIAGGAITGGEQDFVDFANFTESDLINPTGSSVTTAADGNLQITLATCLGADCTQNDTNVGVAGVETLSGSVLPLNPNKALITEFDASASSSGELSLQDPTAAAATPSGGYAFGLNGVDSGFCQAAFGGVINVDDIGGTVGTISGAGSIFDANDCTATFPAQTFAASTVSAPDAFGRVIFTLNPTANFSQIVLVGYIVGANKIQLVEGFDSFVGTTGGTAFSQGANTGTFTAASVSGNTYVVGLIGFDTCYALQTAGLFTFNADGSISGFINYNDTCGVGVQPPSAITGTWVEDVGTGRVTLTGVTDGTITFNAQIDLDGNGNLLALSMDSNDILQGRGFQQSGGGAFAATSFSGAYAMGVTGYDFNFEDEFDAVGPVAANGAGTFAGFTDLNWIYSTGPGPTFSDAPVSGTFTADASGVFTSTVTGVDVTSCSAFNALGTGCTADAFTYYLIDATGDNIAIETDQNQVTLGYFLQQ